MGELPDVPPGFAGRLRAALDAVAATRAALTRTSAESEEARQSHAGIVVDTGLLARQDEIQRLLTETGAHAKAAADLPRIQAEADGYSHELDGLAVRLGLAGQVDVAAAQPADADKALVRRFAEEGRRLRDDLLGKSRLLADERAALEDLRRQRSARGALADPKPLRDRFDAMTPVLRELPRQADLDLAIGTAERKLAEAALRLNPAIEDTAALATAALPSLETVTDFRDRWAAHAETLRRAEAAMAEATDKARAAESRLAPLSLAGPVASPEAIAAARGSRDGTWRQLRGSLLGEPDAPQENAVTLATVQFERQMSDADRLADAASSDAQRIADHASESRALGDERRKLAEVGETADRLGQEIAQIEGTWLALWDTVGVVPRGPIEMLAWLNSVGALRERREEIEVMRDERKLLARRVADAEPVLHSLAGDLGLPAMDGLGPAIVADAVSRALEDLRDSWDEARDLDTRVRDAEVRVQRLAAELAEAEAADTLWRGRWAVAVAALKLDRETTPEQAEAALLAWDAVPNVIRERDSRRRRVEGMRRSSGEFQAAVAALAAAVAPDLVATPADMAVRAMNDRLVAAGRLQAQQAEAAQRLARAAEAVRAAETAGREAQRALETASAGIPADTDLYALCEKLGRRDELAQALADKRGQMAIVTDGQDEDAVRRDLAGFDADQAEATLLRLAEEEARLAGEANEVFADHREELKRRAELEMGYGAEFAVQQRRNAEAELAGAAREWAVLRLAALLLDKAMDRHRAGQQDPLMRRSAELFATLTCGDFDGFTQDFDNNDMPRIAGKRPSGEAITMEGLSEGTRDQLYPALRLAYLEDYAQRAEPAPFIGDDLFATFDDRRTVAG